MIRKKKHKEENIYIRAILFIVPTMAIMILLILFIINASSILTKYDVVNNKSETMYKYSKKYDFVNENKKYNLLNSIINFITTSRFHYRKFEWIEESLFFRVTIMFFISFASALFSNLVIHKIKKEGLNKKKLIIHFFPLIWIGITIFALIMLKDNIINSKEYLSTAAGITTHKYI
ncbi:hypothetical protein R4K55_12905 [Brachyspira alvinipulli]|uniref:hypothetical protein n=1 Tax=Brachyspira alvinipulli TaxID=84379 RepID=UPI00300532C2